MIVKYYKYNGGDSTFNGMYCMKDNTTLMYRRKSGEWVEFYKFAGHDGKNFSGSNFLEITREEAFLEMV